MIKPHKETDNISISENGYIKMTFTSVMKAHNIAMELDLNRHEALINDMKIQSYAPVELTVLLKNIVMELKKLNIHYIIQQVTKSDWINILRPYRLFTFVNENKTYGYLNVKCKIDNFPEAVMKGLGFVDIKESNTNNEMRGEDND